MEHKGRTLVVPQSTRSDSAADSRRSRSRRFQDQSPDGKCVGSPNASKSSMTFILIYQDPKTERHGPAVADQLSLYRYEATEGVNRRAACSGSYWGPTRRPCS